MKLTFITLSFLISITAEAQISRYSCLVKGQALEVTLSKNSMELVGKDDVQMGVGTKLFGTKEFRFYSPLQFGVIFPTPVGSITEKDGEIIFHITEESDKTFQLAYPCTKVMSCGYFGEVRIKFPQPDNDTVVVYYWIDRFDEGGPSEYVELPLTKIKPGSYKSDKGSFKLDGQAGTLNLTGNAQNLWCQ